MRVVTAAEMKEIDLQASEVYGVPSIVLMENAGIRVVEVIESIVSEVKDKVITILVGKGNNGGDGLVVARHLLNRGAQVKLLLLADPEEFRGDARVNLNIWQKLGQPFYQVNQLNGINIVKVALLNTHLVVDAIYGTGFRGTVNERVGRVIELINASNLPVVAVDIPSGLEADTGQASGPCIKASHTVTFGLPKLGLVVEPGATLAGRLSVVDISLPKILTESKDIKRQLLTKELVASWFKPRSSTGHKGTYGHVLVVAGSRGMVGAARMTAQGALRAGAGLVTLAVPQKLQPVVAATLDEAMTIGLPETEQGALAQTAREEILEACRRADVLALGPGLGRQPETVELVKSLLPELEIPVVLDADALNALAGATPILADLKVPAVITPHPGEMGRLLGIPVDQVQNERLKIACEAAQEWQVVTLLKGARTLIAVPGGELYINPTGNPGMASGGSGDVLTGVLAGLMAQGLAPGRAAAAAAFLHGLAGDLAAEKLGELSMLAGDILSYLPEAIKNVYL
ncbi:bifunctional ADP-dependent NAD(P)H-hydrate dehydratase/NAD(P)H-hydrate epimerase [Desulforamulus ferrireducens]|uniref:Bifunctional NAD(P)H-hydrate repair enzyme n=1 Tax=Desulforamulus ferrireducens TaxID=1833852 RepID=A0A1S6IZE0_9FIRM|nr:bifunctional ADP-dependent NAD(P)H-hydrate dehydratase/NAD(P)H-hydrate epimerase [Desulforamulus ferrireducens]AQS60136.1 bifunctional ADP-dependent (S)-NAD(P)H-hydrate dehydratase/NAD(P)H-hydrate epimerase [Desulforamulus ferrireducens]